jgi:Nucleotidyl transferase AbiEii toxin, Type IV TA system
MTMTTRTYTSPQSFKQALEQRLRTATSDGAGLVRKRQLLVFDRFLARAIAVLGDAVLLKGGLVLELRLERARTTKDIDLRVTGSPETVLAQLQEAGRKDLGDFMSFEVAADADQPTIQNDGMQYEGLRFRAECRLAGKLYGQRFGVDVAFGDPILGDPTTVAADDLLEFAGVAPPVLRLYPIETHIAEKLHAYTMPRVRPNTRVKDLPDMALLATTESLEATRLRAALEATFTFRATHLPPSSLPLPPETWVKPYGEMARENELPWKTLEQVTAAAGSFLNPVLRGHEGVWVPDTWAWEPSQAPAAAPFSLITYESSSNRVHHEPSEFDTALEQEDRDRLRR